MKTTTKKFPIIAGMEYNSSGKIVNAKMRQVGYYIIRFTHTDDGALIEEKQIKRVINK